ncbi:MAG: hypothetical protein ACTHU1_13265 [Arachnia sp.]
MNRSTTPGGQTSISLAGGCEDCNAFQTVDDRDAPVFIVRVHHDDTCPTLREMENPR